MSGGSYDYLYSKDLLENTRADLEMMADRLHELGHLGPEIATRKIVLACEVGAELRDVWRAVEWLDSSDGGAAVVALEAARWAEATA